MLNVTLDKEKYAKVEDWHSFFKHKTMSDALYDPSWTKLFAKLKKHPQFAAINDALKTIVEQDPNVKIYPKPSYLFNAFLVTPATELSVVILGQDPYFNCEYFKGIHVPQAMGLSFSVPHNLAIPSSLNNIYENLLKYGHIKTKPSSGNLWFWALQGCLLLNTALTVKNGKKMSHASYWEWFTTTIIEYIANNFDNIIFVLWGKEAYSKLPIIGKKHHTIISSHPSGFSANTPFRQYPSFANCDHFGEINKILVKLNKPPIIWDSITI